MNSTKQENLPSQKKRDEISDLNHNQPSNASDIFLLEAIAKQVADSETETAKAIANIQDQIEELIMIIRTGAQEQTRVYPNNAAQIKAEHEAKGDLEEKAKANEKLLEMYGTEATTRVEFETKVEAERQAKTEAEAKAKSYVKASVGIIMELYSLTQAKVEVEKKLKAEIQARQRAELQAQTEAQEKAKAKRRIQVQAKVIANVQAQLEELVMMFRAEAQKKTRAYTDMLTKVKAEHEEKAVIEEKARACEKLHAKNDLEAIGMAESNTKSETEKQIRTSAKADKQIDKLLVKEMFYPQRSSWSQWLLRGIREDNITAVIVFCFLLYIVPCALAIFGYFGYILLHTFP
jgi:hypothetical protein